MKKWKIIIILSLIAIIIEQGIFLYAEKIYLAADKNLVVEKVEETEESNTENSTEITLSGNIDEVQVSDSGRFVSYIKNGKITILDSKDNSEKQIDCDDEIVYCKWKTNEDNLIILKRVRNGNEEYIEQMPYNAKKDELSELSDFDRKKSRIDCEVTDKVDKVVYSSLTSTMYIKVLKSTGKSNLYYINIQNDVKKVRENILLDNIAVPSNANKCVMEIGGKITLLDGKDNITTPAKGKIKLLGTDFNNNVYFGEEENDKVYKIYFKDVNNSSAEWTTLTLSKNANISDIVINTDGTVYVNDSLEQKVTEITNDKSIDYDGEFVQGIKNGFISRKGNTLIKNYFK